MRCSARAVESWGVKRQEDWHTDTRSQGTVATKRVTLNNLARPSLGSPYTKTQRKRSN